MGENTCPHCQEKLGSAAELADHIANQSHHVPKRDDEFWKNPQCVPLSPVLPIAPFLFLMCGPHVCICVCVCVCICVCVCVCVCVLFIYYKNLWPNTCRYLIPTKENDALLSGLDDDEDESDAMESPRVRQGEVRPRSLSRPQPRGKEKVTHTENIRTIFLSSFSLSFSFPFLFSFFSSLCFFFLSFLFFSLIFFSSLFLFLLFSFLLFSSLLLFSFS